MHWHSFSQLFVQKSIKIVSPYHWDVREIRENISKVNSINVMIVDPFLYTGQLLFIFLWVLSIICTYNRNSHTPVIRPGNHNYQPEDKKEKCKETMLMNLVMLPSSTMPLLSSSCWCLSVKNTIVISSINSNGNYLQVGT